MKQRTVFVTSILLAFLAGVGFAALNKHAFMVMDDAPHVTGIGGVFFKCANPKEMREWYHVNLGLKVNQYGAVFEWYQGADSTKKGFSQWSPFKQSTNYFEPSRKDFMINYRVTKLEEMVAQLQSKGIRTTDSIQKVSYGKFVHLMDPEGNKLELWEPNDSEYEQLGRSMGAPTTK